MANVTQSLFGFTPQDIQAQRMAELDKRTAAFAQLTPMQQAQASFYRAGSMFGDVAAGALGYEDPQVAQARARQGLLGGLDMNDPESLLKAAQSVQATDPQAALALVNQANTLKGTQAGIAKTQSEMEMKQVAYQNRFRALKSQFPEMTDDVAQGLALDEVAFREFFKDKQIKFSNTVEEISKELFNKPFNQLTSDEARRVNLLKEQREGDKAAKSATKVINTTGTAENKYAQEVGQLTAKQDVALIEGVKTAPAAIKKLEETLNLINTGKINTGIARGLQDVVARARSKFLKDQNAGVNVADSQYLDSLLGSDVFNQIQALGIGARGLDTPAEREFLLSVVTGTRDLDTETLRRMAQFRLDAVRNSVQSYNDKITSGELDQYQRVTGRTLKPLETGVKPPANQGSWSIRPVN
jgi:hypothetical protein